MFSAAVTEVFRRK